VFLPAPQNVNEFSSLLGVISLPANSTRTYRSTPEQSCRRCRRNSRCCAALRRRGVTGAGVDDVRLRATEQIEAAARAARLRAGASSEVTMIGSHLFPTA
jgi:hypothetical protein